MMAPTSSDTTCHEVLKRPSRANPHDDTIAAVGNPIAPGALNTPCRRPVEVTSTHPGSQGKNATTTSPKPATTSRATTTHRASPRAAPPHRRRRRPGSPHPAQRSPPPSSRGGTGSQWHPARSGRHGSTRGDSSEGTRTILSGQMHPRQTILGRVHPLWASTARPAARRTQLASGLDTVTVRHDQGVDQRSAASPPPDACSC